MTIKDIARESGYAVGTVSRVLNGQSGVSEEARQKVMEVVEKYHFHMNTNAKRLKQQYNNGIAMIVKGTRNMLFAGMVETLQKLIEERGYACILYYIGENENEVEEALQVCQDRQPVGMIFLGSSLENFRERFDYIRIPCVMVTNGAEELTFENLSSVSIDDREAGRTAIEYLISRGHEKIGILGGEMTHRNPARARYEGCLEALQAHQISFDENKNFVASLFSMEGGYRAMTELLEKMPEITAVFAMSDMTAFAAIRAIKDRGLRVPEDISVVGFDGTEMGQYLVPKLTTIQQPGQVMAQKAVEILHHCIMNRSRAVKETVEFQLIQGESVRALFH